MLRSLNIALYTHSIQNVKVFTNDQVILKEINLSGLDVYLINITPEEKNTTLLPPGSMASVKYMTRVLKTDFNKLIIINFRNPLLNSDLLESALAKYIESKVLALISVKRTIDHPCQLKAYYKIMGVGFIHLFDEDLPYSYFKKFRICTHSKVQTDMSKQKLKITRSFYFDWKSRRIKKKCTSGIYIRTQDGFRINYTPLETLSNDKSFENISSFWLYDSHNTARILFQSNQIIEQLDTGRQCIGVALNENSISAILCEDPNEGKYYLTFNSGHLIPGHYSIKILPVNNSGKKEAEYIYIQPEKDMIPIQFPFDVKNQYGFAYSLLIPAVDDTSNFEKNFPPKKSLWEMKYGIAVNTETGYEILGRQHFPEVFEPDSSLVITDSTEISSLERNIAKGKSIGFILEDENSILIKTKFDLLRHKALLKSHAQAPFPAQTSK